MPCPMPPLTQDRLVLMRARFDTVHEQNSGHKAETEPVELVSLRLISFGLVPQAKLSPARSPAEESKQAKTGERKVYFGKGTWHPDDAIYERKLLEPGHKISGPAIDRADGHHHRDSAGTGSHSG